MDAEQTGKYIAEHRKRKQMTQRELAGRLGVTNKAVSKWETGQGMPDISVLLELARVLEVLVEEILRGESAERQAVERRSEKGPFQDGTKRVIEAEESAGGNGASDDIEKNSLKKYINFQKVRFRFGHVAEGAGWILFILGMLCLVLQAWYLVNREEYQIEYMAWWMFYAVNGGALCLLALGGLCVRKLRNFLLNPVVAASLVILFAANLGTAVLVGTDQREIIRISPGFPPVCMVLKIDEDSGASRLYRPAGGLFVRAAEEFPFTVAGEVKTQWLERDVCAVTYESAEDNNVHQFVATYGDRSNGIAYYYVSNVLLGTWVGADGYRLELTDGLGGRITLETPRGAEVYDYEDCLQYGTLALVLPGQGPKWTLVLNRDSILERGETTLNDGGTITLCRVSMKDTTPVELKRVMDGSAG